MPSLALAPLVSPWVPLWASPALSPLASGSLPLFSQPECNTHSQCLGCPCGRLSKEQNGAKEEGEKKMPENRIIDSHREMFLLQVRGQNELAGA